MIAREPVSKAADVCHEVNRKALAIALGAEAEMS
jgi:hypothetical protein